MAGSPQQHLPAGVKQIPNESSCGPNSPELSQAQWTRPTLKVPPHQGDPLPVCHSGLPALASDWMLTICVRQVASAELGGLGLNEAAESDGIRAQPILKAASMQLIPRVTTFRDFGLSLFLLLSSHKEQADRKRRLWCFVDLGLDELDLLLVHPPTSKDR